MKLSKPDPFLEQFLDRIPSKTAVTFNPTQLEILKQIFGNRASRKHTVDLQLRGGYREGDGKKRRTQMALISPLSKDGLRGVIFKVARFKCSFTLLILLSLHG